MQIFKVFSIYDEKSKAFLRPFLLSEVGQAIRAIHDCLTDPQHDFAKHPSDYTLFQLGEFDDSTGSYTNDKTSLGNLVELKPQPIPEPRLKMVHSPEED